MSVWNDVASGWKGELGSSKYHDGEHTYDEIAHRVRGVIVRRYEAGPKRLPASHRPWQLIISFRPHSKLPGCQSNADSVVA
jgi:hypothetical protein